MIRKIIFLGAICLTFSSNVIAQVSVKILSYPTEFAPAEAGQIQFARPSVGQPALVVEYKNVEEDVDGNDKVFIPIRLASNINTSLSGSTLTGPDVTAITDNAGSSNEGVSSLHAQVPQTSVQPNIISRETNADGTMNIVMAITRFDRQTRTTGFTDGTDYGVVVRWEGNSHGDAGLFEVLPIVDQGSGLEFVPMTFNESATAETEANLLANASAALSSDSFVKNDITHLVTSSNPVATEISINAEGAYSIFSISGQTVASGEFDGTVNVENLTSGVYILSVNEGTYQFIKE